MVGVLERYMWFAGVVGIFVAIVYFLNPSRMKMHQSITGPHHTSHMFDLPETTLSRYDEGGTNRMAIFLTDENSNWLGLAHGLKTVGVPFIVTTDAERAMQHDVVLTYPMISGRSVNPVTIRALASYTEKGGTLISTNVLGGGLGEVFGFDGVRETKEHAFLEFDTQRPEYQALETIGVPKIKIGSETKIATNPGTNVYLNPVNPPIAAYGNGEAAIVMNEFGRGKAYAVGLDIGQIALKGQNFKEEDISWSYANHFQPTLDVLLHFIAGVYQDNEPDALKLGTVPNGQKLAVMMTHDVDYLHSVKNALEYAKMEAEHGVRSTYFIQTKYMQDYNDVSFMDEAGTKYLEDLSAMDLEIASHSVSHSLQFHEFAVGTGQEALPDYRPIVRNSETTQNASLMGEMRVSKFILETIAGQEVKSFRPGYLRVPPKLPETLKWSGYSYSSAVTSNKSLTHMPFQLMESRLWDTEIDIYEFPITIEDELPPKMGDRLQEAIAVAERLSNYGGTMVTLSHPDILDHKFEFAEGFIKAVKPYAWFGTMSEFGDWWAARDNMAVDVYENQFVKTIELQCPKQISGLTLNVPSEYGLPGDVLGGEIIETTGDQWLINCTSETMTITVDTMQAMK